MASEPQMLRWPYNLIGIVSIGLLIWIAFNTVSIQQTLTEIGLGPAPGEDCTFNVRPVGGGPIFELGYTFTGARTGAGDYSVRFTPAGNLQIGGATANAGQNYTLELNQLQTPGSRSVSLVPSSGSPQSVQFTDRDSLAPPHAEFSVGAKYVGPQTGNVLLYFWHGSTGIEIEVKK